MTTLLINSSLRGHDSITRSLSHQLADQLNQNTDSHIIHRDLREPLEFVTEQSFSAAQIPQEKRSTEQQQAVALADSLIDELLIADTVIIGAPVYNFGPPASLKAWADLVARAGTTFNYTPEGPKGLLKGKKAYIIAVSGGTPIGSDSDFLTNWLAFFLGFLGIHDVTLISADGTMGGDGPAKISAAQKTIAGLAT